MVEGKDDWQVTVQELLYNSDQCKILEAGMNVKEQGKLKGHKRQITDNSLY